MKTKDEFFTELTEDAANAVLYKLINGELVACSPEERLAIISERATALAAHALPPTAVPFRSLAFALLEAGLYTQVKTVALSSTEGEIWWSTAQSSTVRRDHPFVAALGAAIGQTSDQLDVLFVSAAAYSDA